jgi:hypothetical protein
MAYATLQRLISHPSPAFVCEAAGATSDLRFTARIHHELRPPATPEDLAYLRRILPLPSDQVAKFYMKHDGCLLYCDTLSETAGIEIYRIAEIPTRTVEMYEWLTNLESAADSNRLKTSIAIGEAPQSGNHFAMPVEGAKAGCVFYIDHDDWREEPFAATFDQFLERISTSPVRLLAEDLGFYARYSDGQSDKQWIPIEYTADSAPRNPGDATQA